MEEELWEKMLKDALVDEKTALMRHLIDLFFRIPLSQGEFLDKSWQIYMVVEKV